MSANFIANDSMGVELPLVRQLREGIVVKQGGRSIALSNAGGKLLWLDAQGATRGEAEIFAELETPEGSRRVWQSLDTAPRLVVCEQGPLRTVLRTQFDALDERGKRWGEGLADWTLNADGSLYAVLALRLINADESARLVRAGAQVSFPEGAAPQWLNVEASAGGQAVAVGDLSVAWRRGEAPECYGGAGPWVRFGDKTPYYEDWGNLPSQGWGSCGWQSSAVQLSSGVNGGSVLTLPFDTDFGDEPFPVECPLLGYLLLAPTDSGEIEQRVAEWQKPEELEIEGGSWRGAALADNTHLIYAPGAQKVRFSLPASRVPTAVHIYGLSHWGAWSASCDGNTLRTQLVNDGRATDDPNGMHLGRFDNRHGPIYGYNDAPANRVHLTVPASSKVREVVLRAGEGLALSYLRWDDRHLYVIQSSAKPGSALGEFAARDAKLRRLTAPHSAESTIDAVPLYWYQCNTPTPYYAAEEVTRYVLTNAGPDAIALEVHARNRFGRGTGVFRACIPFDKRYTRLDVSADLAVEARWHFEDLQLLNLFPERFRDFREWPHKYAFCMDSTGRKLLKHPKEGRMVIEGVDIRDQVPPFIFAHYSAKRGNYFLLQYPMSGPVTCGHFLCPHWLDSHYHAVSPTGKLEAGDKVSGSYKLVIDCGAELTTEQVEGLCKEVLAGTELVAALDALE